MNEPGRPTAPRPIDNLPHKVTVPNRLVVIELVYFQSEGGPVSSEARFERRLSSDEQPYPPPRITIKDTQVVTLDDARKAGWLMDQPLGLIHVVNDGPGVLMIEFFDKPVFRVRPGESFRAEPLDLSEVALRASGGPCTVKYTLFPA
jgi:hypothetical protein